MLKLVVLISGTGSNLRALLDASADAEFPARVVAIGADRDAEGLALGEEFGVPTFSVPFTAYPDRDAWGDALIAEVARWEPDVVVLSGLMRLVPPAVVDAFVERIEARLATRRDESERAIQRRRNHQKEMILGGMGISVPLLLIAAIFTGLPGVIAVCVALVALGVVVMRDDA